MQLINLTSHDIVIRTPDGDNTIPPSGEVARVASTPGERIGLGPATFLYAAPTWGEVVGLPEPVPGTLYIVPAHVAARCEGRADVFSPGTGPADGAFRNAAGQIEAVSRLIQAPQPTAPEAEPVLEHLQPCSICGETATRWGECVGCGAAG